MAIVSDVSDVEILRSVPSRLSGRDSTQDDKRVLRERLEVVADEPFGDAAGLARRLAFDNHRKNGFERIGKFFQGLKSEAGANI